jgi:hypothetical protein
MASCKSCGAAIRWVTVVRAHGRGERAMPIDAEPSATGNVLLTGRNDRGPVARVLGAGESGVAGTPLYLAHFASCPNAKQHRKPRGDA